MDAPENPSVCQHKEQCRLTYHGAITTCLGYTPIYDGNGKRVDAGDPNTRSVNVRCGACNASWWKVSQYDKTTWTRIEPQREECCVCKDAERTPSEREELTRICDNCRLPIIV